MTKDVLLSIKGLQIGENEQNDTIEVISPGDYYFRNGRHFFMYEEVMEGQKESTRNMIKVRDNYMELTKKGAVNVHMIFEKNKKSGNEIGLFAVIYSERTKRKEVQGCRRRYP